MSAGREVNTGEGGVPVRTTTEELLVRLFPALSVTVHLTVVMPGRKTPGASSTRAGEASRLSETVTVEKKADSCAEPAGTFPVPSASTMMGGGTRRPGRMGS